MKIQTHADICVTGHLAGRSPFCMFKQGNPEGTIGGMGKSLTWIRFHGSLSKAPSVATQTHPIKGLLAIM